jgi:hypothetical protein
MDPKSALASFQFIMVVAALSAPHLTLSALGYSFVIPAGMKGFPTDSNSSMYFALIILRRIASDIVTEKMTNPPQS